MLQSLTPPPMDWKRHIEENAARGSSLCPFSAKPAAGVLGAPGPVQQALAMKGTEKEEHQGSWQP